MDYSKYSPDWKDVIRPSILRRDSYRCTVCGVGHKKEVYKNTNGSYVELDSFTKEWALAQGKKVFKMYLQVAHLDHDTNNNDSSNLKTLCPMHHAKFDSQHKAFSRRMYKAVVADKSNKDSEELFLLSLDKSRYLFFEKMSLLYFDKKQEKICLDLLDVFDMLVLKYKFLKKNQIKK
jgi:hypothetical protein